MKSNYIAHLRSQIRSRACNPDRICLKELEFDFENLFDVRLISESYRGILLSYLPKLLLASDDLIASNWLFDVYWDGSHSTGITSIRATKFMSMFVLILW